MGEAPTQSLPAAALDCCDPPTLGLLQPSGTGLPHRVPVVMGNRPWVHDACAARCGCRPLEYPTATKAGCCCCERAWTWAEPVLCGEERPDSDAACVTYTYVIPGSLDSQPTYLDSTSASCSSKVKPVAACCGILLRRSATAVLLADAAPAIIDRPVVV